MWCVAIFVFFVILISMTLIARSISNPVRKLMGTMETFGKGQLDTRVQVTAKDEIGQMGEAFNQMAEKTEHLVQEVATERSLKQQAQLMALQMQINPHFLYNTLETINWLAIEKGSSEISDVARNLGKLMRFSLKKEKECSLEEELDAIERYIGIQRYRYGKSLHLSIHAEEEALYESVPIHILLPIVENAVEHGVSDQKGEKNIWIQCRIKGEKLQMSVCDNGSGIPDEKKKEIQSMQPPKENAAGHTSIGLVNVQKRLKFYYGENGTFKIKDRRGRGTVILIKIPVNN